MRVRTRGKWRLKTSQKWWLALGAKTSKQLGKVFSIENKKIVSFPLVLTSLLCENADGQRKFVTFLPIYHSLCPFLPLYD